MMKLYDYPDCPFAQKVRVVLAEKELEYEKVFVDLRTGEHRQNAEFLKLNPYGKVPVLIGVAVGDDATPGIGSKNLAKIGPAEKTTPSGRFLAKYGRAVGKQRVLWVDYATSVALHPIPPGASPKERRRQRMLSPTPDDNRITFGCINVPSAFYSKRVQPLFQKRGGYVYVLPDTKPLEVVFPALRAQPLVASTAP